MAGAHREGVRRTVFSHPDFPATGEGCRPSAPASDRICWPSAQRAKALAGSCRRPLRASSTYRRWGIAPRP